MIVKKQIKEEGTPVDDLLVENLPNLDIMNSPKRLVVERGILSKLLETSDMSTIKDLQITPKFFTPEYGEVFKYLDEFYLKNNSLPTPRVISNKFPDVKLESYINTDGLNVIGTAENLQYWCNELRVRAKHNYSADKIERVAELLNEGRTSEAIALMNKTVLAIESDYVETSAIDTSKNAEQRKSIYEKRKENLGMIGIPTGIPKLDLVLKGIQPKQLITLIASTGVGKSWFYVLLASHCMLNNYKVLFLTTEMSEEQIEDRIEAVLMGKLYKEFNYNRFKSGTLTPQEEEMYYDFLERKKHLEPLYIETATGASNVNAKIQQYKPDIVFIDSCYLMEDDRGAEQDWLRVAHITRDLKMIAKNNKIPICINSQADATTSKKTGPELENIGFSKAIGMDSDVVLSLFRDEEMREDNEMKVKVLKQREGILTSVLLNWDFSTMDFSALQSDVSDKQVMTGERSNFVQL